MTDIRIPESTRLQLASIIGGESASPIFDRQPIPASHLDTDTILVIDEGDRFGVQKVDWDALHVVNRLDEATVTQLRLMANGGAGDVL